MKKKFASIRISTTVSQEIWNNYQEINHNKAKCDRISWADCIRRGFYSILDEKKDSSVLDILNNEYVPLKVKDRVRRLSEKLSELAKELDLLKSGTGIVEIKPSKED